MKIEGSRVQGGVKRVGILGAGQLARMMAMAARTLGMSCFVLAQKETDCAIPVAEGSVISDGSLEKLKEFCKNIDVLTVENEFIDLEWLEKGLGETPFYPGIHCLRQIQDKLEQKKNLFKKKLAALDFIAINSREDLEKAGKNFGENLVIKAARLGYDGRGTFIFDKENKFDPSVFWEKCGRKFRGYAEPLASFEKELAVVVARSVSGEMISYPVIETNQTKGICLWAKAPTDVKPVVAAKAQELARGVIKGFEGVGVFGVEMFLLSGDQVVINEIAPRVHNSGHLTMDGCEVGQFEMHLRAIAGLPLQGEKLLWPAMAMANIIGKKKNAGGGGHLINEIKGLEGVWPHWYQKSGETLGRKLGHINAKGNSPTQALNRALEARAQISI